MIAPTDERLVELMTLTSDMRNATPRTYATVPDELKSWIRENAPELVRVLDFLRKNPVYLGPIKRMAEEES